MAALEMVKGELIEEYGQIVSGYRIYFIKFVGQSSIQTALFNALDDSSVPQPGDAWSSELSRLCVCRRTPQLRVWKAGDAKIFIRVEYALEYPDKGYPLRGGGSLAQISTGKDAVNMDITVSYGSKTVKRPISVFAPEAVEIRETVELTDHPHQIRQKWLNHINEDVWCDEDPHRWLIARIEYELVNAHVTPNRYRFTWEFQKSPLPHGWRPQVIYQKPNGEIPSDAVFEEKFWYIDKTFSEKFPWTGEVLRG